MRLTPLDIHHKEFRRSIRGYNEEEVDAFLDEIAAEFERFFKENVEYKEKCQKFQDKLDQYENIEQTLQNTLVTAQKSADEIQGNAKKEAELVVRDSQLRSREIIREAEKEREIVQRAVNSLKQAEEEFRLKFRSQLESYLGLVDEIEKQTKQQLSKEAQQEKEKDEAKKIRKDKKKTSFMPAEIDDVDETRPPLHAAERKEMKEELN